MTMQPNKFNGCPQKQEKPFTSADNPFDAALLSMKIDCQSPIRRNGPRLLPHREKETSDEVFQALLADANRELASLLQDVRVASRGALPGATSAVPT